MAVRDTQQQYIGGGVESVCFGPVGLMRGANQEWDVLFCYKLAGESGQPQNLTAKGGLSLRLLARIL